MKKFASISSIAVFFVITLVPGFAAAAEQDASRMPAKSGEEVAQQCVVCHGEDGNGIAPSFPRIAGQHADYMFYALKSYQDGTRKNAIMVGIVAALSEEEMENVAQYYANMDGGLSVVDIDDESMH